MHESHSHVNYGMLMLEKYAKIIEAGYMCNKCEMFHLLFSTGRNARLKFINEPVKSLSDHPWYFLSSHQNSSIKQASNCYKAV